MVNNWIDLKLAYFWSWTTIITHTLQWKTFSILKHFGEIVLLTVRRLSKIIKNLHAKLSTTGHKMTIMSNFKYYNFLQNNCNTVERKRLRLKKYNILGIKKKKYRQVPVLITFLEFVTVTMCNAVTLFNG